MVAKYMSYFSTIQICYFVLKTEPGYIFNVQLNPQAVLATHFFGAHLYLSSVKADQDSILIDWLID